MKKNTIITVILFFSAVTAQAQKITLKINGGVESPLEIFKEGYKTGWGIFGTGYYEIDKNANLLLSVGATGWQTQEGNNNSGLLLVRPGYRHFVYKGVYLQLDMGFAIYTGFWGNSPTRFSYGFGPGYFFGKKNKKGFDVSIRANRSSYRYWLEYCLGYQFKL